MDLIPRDCLIEIFIHFMDVCSYSNYRCKINILKLVCRQWRRIVSTCEFKKIIANKLTFINEIKFIYVYNNCSDYINLSSDGIISIKRGHMNAVLPNCNEHSFNNIVYFRHTCSVLSKDGDWILCDMEKNIIMTKTFMNIISNERIAHPPDRYKIRYFTSDKFLSNGYVQILENESNNIHTYTYESNSTNLYLHMDSTKIDFITVNGEFVCFKTIDSKLHMFDGNNKIEQKVLSLFKRNIIIDRIGFTSQCNNILIQNNEKLYLIDPIENKIIKEIDDILPAQNVHKNFILGKSGNIYDSKTGELFCSPSSTNSEVLDTYNGKDGYYIIMKR